MGATVTWLGNSAANTLATASFTFGGVTHVFSGRIENGNMMIDPAILHNAFGWGNTNQLTSLAGAGVAGIGFVAAACPITMGKEWGQAGGAIGPKGKLAGYIAGAIVGGVVWFGSRIADALRSSNNNNSSTTATGGSTPASPPPPNGSDDNTPNRVEDLARNLRDWLGNDARMITNSSGDRIFISKDGLRRVRFDINNPSPHQSSHGHVERLVNGSWQKSGPLFPINAPQK